MMFRLPSIMSALARGDRAASAADSCVAVLDVGSNSVRLVIYRLCGRAMSTIVNEKVMAGLGRDLPATGRLSPAGRDAALASLKRFRDIIDGMEVSDIVTAATAAVRDAEDGDEFTAEVRQQTGFKLRVLSGVEEGRISARGVLVGAPDASGLAADLGGSSLELTQIHAGEVGPAQTFPLGPLALMQPNGFDLDRVRAVAGSVLAPIELAAGPALYCVGGAWRALGKVQIARREHPIPVLHQFEMVREEALDAVDFVRKQTRRQLERLSESAAKRFEGLPYAATVLEQILERFGLRRVVISSTGLRDGMVWDLLSPAERREEPLIAAARAFANCPKQSASFGPALAAFLDPAFRAADHLGAFDPGRDQVLRAAAAHLADVAGAMHPDQRAQVTFDLVLKAPFVAITHPERAFLASAVHHRYTKAAPASRAYQALLNDRQRKAAAALGVAMRFGADLSARSGVLLRDFRLDWAEGRLRLIAPRERQALLADPALKRFDMVGQAFGGTTEIVIA